MVRTFLLPIFLLIESQIVLLGQWSMTVTAGVSPGQTSGTSVLLVNRSSPQDEFTFQLSSVKASTLLGAGAMYRFAPFFLSAEAQYTQRAYDYTVSYTYPGFGRSGNEATYSEKMGAIAFPVSLGVNLGVVDVTSGFLPQMIVSRQTDLVRLSGYSDDDSRFRFGWHSGIAALVSTMRIGIHYQMDFASYGDHMTVNGTSLRLKGQPSRVVGTLSYGF